MKKGDIIRYRTNVGRYVRVTDVSKTKGVFGIHLSKCGNITGEIRIPCPEQYRVLNVYRLAVTEEEFKTLKRYEVSIRHICNKQWEGFIDAAAETGIDVILFYIGSKRIYYTFEGVKKIMAFVWNNKAHTSGSKQPCVRIFLGNLIAIEE